MGGHPQQLGDLEELVLLAVLRLGAEAYGARIRAELQEYAGRSVSIQYGLRDADAHGGKGAGPHLDG